METTRLVLEMVLEMVSDPEVDPVLEEAAVLQELVDEVSYSAWLALHLQQYYVDAEAHLRHFKFSFAGSSPTLEVLCGALAHRRVNGWRSARIAARQPLDRVRVGGLCG